MKCAVLLEEHGAFRQALAFLLAQDPDIEMVAEASTLEGGRAIVLEDPAAVDVVVTELLLPDGDGTEFLRDLREVDAEIRILVLTIVRDRDSHELALESGATEVLTKDAPVERIVASIKELGGDRPPPPKLRSETRDAG
jgi:DNA-binding NarL/FixJ family response regulator